MSHLRLIAALGLGVTALLFTGAADARPAAKTPSVTSRVASAQQQLRKLPKSTWARGRRTAVLRQLAKASRDAKRKRNCAAAAGLDHARNALLTKRTWKARKVPRKVRKRALPGLGAAEKALIKRGGRKCAKPQRAKPAPKSQVGGGGFTPEPSRGIDKIEQGEPEEPLATGRYRPITDAGPEATVDEPSPVTPQPFRLTPPGRPSAHLLAAGPLTLFGASDVGVPPRTAEPQEPTTAVGKNVAVFTGNTSVGFSLDGGATWTRMDPSTILKDPANQPLCCDQLVTYSKAQNMFVWLLQYWCTPGTSAPVSNDCRNAGTGQNLLRIAWSSPEEVRQYLNTPTPGRAWHFRDFSPAFFGIGGSTWFDRSDIGVNSAYLNFTTDVLRSGDSTASLLGRMSLAQIKADGTIGVNWITDTIPRMTVAQGTDTAWTYYAGAVNLSQTRVWDWAPNGLAQVFPHNIDHDTIPVLNGAINGTDGADWYARWSIFAGAVESAVWKGNELIVSQGTGRDQCTDKCGTGSDVITHVFDHPGAYISRFNTNDWTLASDRWLRLRNTNIGWPFLALAEDGTVGAAFVGAPDGGNPRPIAAFLDERKYVYALAAGQPQGGGDYYSLRPGRTSSSFVIPVRSNEVDADGVTRTHWRYIEYGHGAPPSATPPNVRITSPEEGREFNTGAPIAFNATVSDYQDGVVLESAIVWQVDGVEIGRGSRVVYSAGAPGAHVATVTATDGTGLSTTQTVNYTVQTPGGPTVAITAPDDNQTYFAEGDETNGEYKDLAFTATASDPTGAPLTYTWTDMITEFDQSLGKVVVTGPFSVSTALSPTLRLHVTGHNCGLATHDLTLTVSNGTQTATAATTQKVKTGLCVR
jgi:hypothetical protein